MTTVSFPPQCAVAVICGEHLISQVYPAGIPVEAFMADIVELLGEDLRRRGMPALDTGSSYELQRVNGTRLDMTRTLDDLGIEDGATLMLVPAGSGESFEPQYESLSTALARVGKRLFVPVTALTAARTALAILALVTLIISGLTVRARIQSESWAICVPALVCAAMLAVGATAVFRWWPQSTSLSDGFAWQAIPLGAVGLAAAAPGHVGSAHLVIATLVAGVSATALGKLTARFVPAATAVSTLCVVGGLAAAVRMWQPVPGQRLGVCTLIALLLLLAVSPTIALWAARIRPPHFGSINGSDLFRRGDGMPVDAVAPVEEGTDEEPRRDATPRGVVIAEAARRANGVLTGLTVAAGVALPAAIWATLRPGQPNNNAATVLVALLVVVFISRGRAFSDRRQAIALVCGGAVGFCTAVVRFVTHWPPGSVGPMLWGSVVLTAFAGAGLAAALLVPVTRFTPMVRMFAEWLELAAVVVALPLAAWVTGLFSWVRMR